MSKGKNIIAGIVAAMTLAVVLILLSAHTEQAPQIKRTELQRHDLSDGGREAIQVRIDFGKGTAFVKHTHPGEEIIYILEGLLEYKVEGKAPVILKQGNVLFIPAGVVHSARNAGNNQAAELATYISQKGKPLVVLQ